MAYADTVFINMCKDVLENGTDTKGEEVRPVWPDTGEKAYTIKKFGVVNRYDLSKEFPALTLRPVPFKKCVDELLWIWQKKSNKIADLNSSIWDSWGDKNGTIGKAYGYQIANKYAHHVAKEEDLSEYPSAEIREVVCSYYETKKYCFLDQIDSVLYDLKHTPYSRRIMTNIYNFHDLHDMMLYPCAYSMTFNVTEKDGKKILNGILNQRSQDILAANAWNVAQYSVLMHMIARHCDMRVGELVHVIADAHIYDRHVDTIKELITREPLHAPTLWINPEKKNFYDFTVDDFELRDYQTHSQIKGIPVAV